MEWRFWKWGQKRKRSAAGNVLTLPKPYSYRQLIALQKTVGNQAVLRWLGLRK